jgi:hypothetical protein
MADVLAGYLARIQADVPALRVASARMNSDGMMNDVVLVNDNLVFRFAKNEPAKTLLAYEAQLLQVIERYVTVPVPRIEHCTDTTCTTASFRACPCTGIRSCAPTQQCKICWPMSSQRFFNNYIPFG